jgi:hypothetical protein
MVGLFARGRIAWVVAIVFGVILLIVGLAMNLQWLWMVGIAFAVVGAIFLIISLVTKGRSD